MLPYEKEYEKRLNQAYYNLLRRNYERGLSPLQSENLGLDGRSQQDGDSQWPVDAHGLHHRQDRD